MTEEQVRTKIGEARARIEALLAEDQRTLASIQADLSRNLSGSILETLKRQASHTEKSMKRYQEELRVLQEREKDLPDPINLAERNEVLEIVKCELRGMGLDADILLYKFTRFMESKR